MSGLETYTFTKSELEEYLDQIKTIIVRNLVEDEFLTFQEGDEWCADHTLKLSEKGFFRTLSDIWKKTASRSYAIVVKAKHNQDK